MSDKGNPTRFIYGVEVHAYSREEANQMMLDAIQHTEGINGWAMARVNPWPAIIENGEQMASTFATRPDPEPDDLSDDRYH